MTAPKLMKGVVLTGHGGLDRLEWREGLPTPEPGPEEVLIQVGASSVNNTDINTRIGWYDKAVRGDTESLARSDGDAEAEGGWSGAPIGFPRIQGADCVGRIVSVGRGVSAERIGERVMVRPMQSTGAGGAPFALWTFGSESDGAFAEYAKAFAIDALPVRSSWSDLELATIPCAYSTAEGMLQRVALGAERVLITGASGGVGSAAVQLAKRRGAHVTAMTSASKAAEVRGLGADQTIDRDDALELGAFDAVVDLVAGSRWPEMINALRPGGRYVASGAIAGPIVELDVRTLYLRDLTLFGATYQPNSVFTDVISYIERGEIRPLIAETYPLPELRAAQEAFLRKSHIGKIAIQVA